MMTAQRGWRTRRWFLQAIPAACLGAPAEKNRTVPSAAIKYADASTEFPVFRLTDPMITSHLPAHYARAIAHRGNFLVYASDSDGSVEAYRMDLKTGISRQLTEETGIEPYSFTLTADERSLCYLAQGRLLLMTLSNSRVRELYRVPQGFEVVPGLSVSEDGLYAALVERKGASHRLRLVRMADGTPATLAEAQEEMADPIPRPRRASVLYRRGGGLWLANYDAQRNARLRLADGETAQACWSPDGRTVFYLNYPADSHKLHNIREFTPDTNQDKALADTTQFAVFERNADASMFVGASASKASPYVLLLSRAVKREFTLCEHRASDARMVSPIFAPNSQHIYFVSDQHGKPAIYSMAVEKIVSETDTTP